MSVSAGIPDFRSPGGMYETLRPELLTATDQQRALMASDPTYVVESSMFHANQFPYLEVRRPFILGTETQTWRATPSHKFLELLHTHGKLVRLYTQNIDGLDYQTAIPVHKICPVHGTMRKVACESCGASMPFSTFCDKVRTNIKDIYGDDPSAPKTSTNIICEDCGNPTVKPTTVLFGSSLPDQFFANAQEDLPQADLVILAGTSLVVSPANCVAYRIPDSARRLVVNRERVGIELGIEYTDEGRDYFLQGDCDSSFIALAELLNWHAELERGFPGPESSDDDKQGGIDDGDEGAGAEQK